MPAPRLPRPLAISTNEKLCPAIILTPSSPLDAPDYYQVLLIPPPPRRSRLAWLNPWRAQPAAIQLPISADSPSFPVTVIHPAADKRRRNRLALVLAIPIILLLIHFLIAMAQFNAYHESQISAPAESLFDHLASFFGFGPASAHHVQEMVDEPAFLTASNIAPDAQPLS